MHVRYRTKKLEKACENYTHAVKKYGIEMGNLIHIRIDQLKSAESVMHLVQHKIGRCHPLTGDREGQYAMNLVHPYRLIFTQYDEATITVQIEEIVDYH